MGEPDRGRRDLVHQERIHGVDDREVHDDAGIGDQEDGEADQLHPGLLAEPQVLADEVDPHVGVPDVAVAEHQREQPGMEVPFELLQHRGVEEAPEDLHQGHLELADLADADVHDRDAHQRQHHPRAEAAHAVDDDPKPIGPHDEGRPFGAIVVAAALPGGGVRCGGGGRCRGSRRRRSTRRRRRSWRRRGTRGRLLCGGGHGSSASLVVSPGRRPSASARARSPASRSPGRAPGPGCSRKE